MNQTLALDTYERHKASRDVWNAIHLLEKAKKEVTQNDEPNQTHQI